MRVCIFIPDLGTIPERQTALLAEASALSGERSRPEICFVGLRQSRPLDRTAPAYQPHVTDHYTRTRLANLTLRLADAGVAPGSAARAALHYCGPDLVEAVLACDPEMVLIDARWGHHLASLLEADFPDRVFVSGRTPVIRHHARPGRGTRASPARVSIVLPTYNGSKYLRESIASCLSQSHRHIELIVVDDGSREDIAALLAGFSDNRVRYVRHDTNRGLPAALNTGFRAATGQLLTWTSDDNYYAPDALERMVTFLDRHPDIAFVYTAMHIIDETGSGAFPRTRTALPPATLTHQNGVGACFLYRREVYREVGGYDSAATLVEDYDYWVRVSKRFRMQRLFDPLYYYRHHSGSLTAQHGADAVAIRLDVVRQQQQRGVA